MKLSFSKEMYPKIALIKAAYAFTDKAYVHLDADQSYYLVQIVPKENNCLDIEMECYHVSRVAKHPKV